MDRQEEGHHCSTVKKTAQPRLPSTTVSLMMRCAKRIVIWAGRAKCSAGCCAYGVLLGGFLKKFTIFCLALTIFSSVSPHFHL
jgi:hypothetical protein